MPTQESPEEGNPPSRYTEERAGVLLAMWGGPGALAILFAMSLIKAVDGERLLPPNVSTQITAVLVIGTLLGWLAHLHARTTHSVMQRTRAMFDQHMRRLAELKLTGLIEETASTGESPNLRSIK
jgi:hypothetical protein